MKDNLMTWEQTIQYIRTIPEYKFLVEKAYFEEDLPLNVERFKNDAEFSETLKLLKEYAPNQRNKKQKILDIGAGNGISSIALALSGYEVTVVEPDKSETIGAGAIRKLKAYYKLENIEIIEAFAENIKLPDANFDIVYARQCMHHAYDLQKFVAESARVLKKGGLFITIRDHVVFGEEDKKWFLQAHPLQRYYGGENAFSPLEYKEAILNADLSIEKEIKYYDSIINYYPKEASEIENHTAYFYLARKNNLKQKIGFLADFKLFQWSYNVYLDKKVGKIKPHDEIQMPGRMYSYICLKK